MKNTFLLQWNVLLGLFFMVSVSQAARASTLILGKLKQDQKAAAVSEDDAAALAGEAGSVAANETISANATKLTGVPQIDYQFDPNLPRELNGYNLTDYPFYNAIPELIEFKCDGLHDGFYASVPHKCQVYHHCLFGTRYDFLCANYTAFDQKTFICHFASEVDCKNSPKYFKRNEALYKQDSTTAAPVPVTEKKPVTESSSGRRRRPFRRRKPSYDDYEDYGDYYEDEDSDSRSKRPRPPSNSKESEHAEDEEIGDKLPNKSLYDRPRVAPKIRRPVPINEREKYDYSGDARVIHSKEVPVDDMSDGEDEKTDSKRKNKPHHDDSADNSKSKERDRYRDRDSEKEPNRSKDRSRIKDGDRDERERNRSKESDRDERDRDRNRNRDIEDDDRDLDRDRDRDRVRVRNYDDDDRDRSRERDRPRDRDRRPPKRRRRPDSYSAEYDYYEYEEVRRPRPRERPRYDDDDYEYDDRYYRKPYRGRDDRDRDRPRDRDLPYRNRDKPKTKDYDKTRDYDDSDERAPENEKDKSTNYRDSDEKKSSEFSERKSLKDTAVDDSVTTSSDNVGRPKGKEPVTSTKSKEEYYDGPTGKERKDQQSNSDTRSPHRSSDSFRSKATKSKQTTGATGPDNSEQPVAAARPAYITTVPKSNENTDDNNSRKPSGFRRPTTTQLPIEYEAVEYTSRNNALTKETTESEAPKAEVVQHFPARPRGGAPKRDKPTSSEDTTVKLKVPFEDPTANEEIAPRAPKIPVSTRRRPFLPSRGGDPTQLRGLGPVGAKAIKKLEEAISDSYRPETATKDRSRAKSSQIDPNQFPTGIEFRAKLTANVGVEQPRLVPGIPEPAYKDDYSDETDSVESAREHAHHDSQKMTDRSFVNLPSKNPSEISRVAFGQTNVQVPEPVASVEDIEKKISDKFAQTEFNSRNNPFFPPQEQQKPQVYQQFGPQTFYSENPKFKTSLSLNEQHNPRPTQTNLNFSPGTHLPTYFQPILKSGQGQVQVVHFQKNQPVDFSTQQIQKPVHVKFAQPGNLEENDELDVSYNDALQPISSIHPRDAQTGVLINQRTPATRRRFVSSQPFLSSQVIDRRQTPRANGPKIAGTNQQTHYILPPVSSTQYSSRDFYPDSFKGFV